MLSLFADARSQAPVLLEHVGPRLCRNEGGTESAEVVRVAAGLVFREGKLLITQRRAGDHLGGLWEFPGGKVMVGESDRACLTRELQEELGIEVELQGLIEDLVHAYPEKTVRLRFFRCQWRRHEPQPLACAALAWVGREELSAYPFPAADARLLRRLSAESEWGCRKSS